MRKNTMWKILISGMLLGSISASVVPAQDFTQCQREYDELIGELIASAGMPAAATTWTILFNSLDLNGNRLVSAAEIVLKLNNEHLVASNAMRSLLPQAQAWINAAGSQNGDKELNMEEFTDVVGETIGKIERASSSNRDWIDAVSNICAYFNKNIPAITQAIRDLSNCTYALRKEQVSSIALHSTEVVVNIWVGTFKTMDMNDDSHLSQDELAQRYLYFHADSNMTSDGIAENIQAFLQEDLLDKSRFLQAVTVLLFGKYANIIEMESSENRAWLNITSIDQLRGKQLFCSILHSTRNDVIAHLQKNRECIASYNNTVDSVLDKDKFIAGDYIFTIADANKNGKVTLEELDSFSGGERKSKSDNNIALLFDEQDDIYFTSENMTSLIPNRMSLEGDKIELSVLSCNQHKVWNAFCLTTIRAINNFPVSIKRDALKTEAPATTAQPSIKDLLAQLRTKLQQKHITLQPEVVRGFLNSLQALGGTERPITTAEEMTRREIFTTPVVSTPVVETTSLEGKVVETTQAEVQATTKKDVTSEMKTSKVYGISEVVQDVISDLKKENDTGADGARDKEMESLLEEWKTTNVSESKNETKKKLTKEEKELYELLEEYRDDMHKEQSLTSTTESSQKPSHNVSSEEIELQLLLEKAIEEQKLV